MLCSLASTTNSSSPSSSHVTRDSRGCEKVKSCCSTAWADDERRCEADVMQSEEAASGRSAAASTSSAAASSAALASTSPSSHLPTTATQHLIVTPRDKREFKKSAREEVDAVVNHNCTHNTHYGARQQQHRWVCAADLMTARIQRTPAAVLRGLEGRKGWN